jgi:hypothetical protein
MALGVECTERRLTDDERRAVERKIGRTSRQFRRLVPNVLVVSGLVCGLLCGLTVLASDVRWHVVVAVWSGIAMVIALPAAFSAWRDLSRQVRRLEEALDADHARVTRVCSDAVVELEEIEDEGACYAFRIGPRKVAFIDGQEFYASRSFPNSDFSLVSILGRDGREIDFTIRKAGSRLTPVRQIPAEVKQRLSIPEHLAVIDAGLDDLERSLARPSIHV